MTMVVYNIMSYVRIRTFIKTEFYDRKSRGMCTQWTYMFQGLKKIIKVLWLNNYA